MDDLFLMCDMACRSRAWTDYTLFGYASGLLFLAGIIFIPTLFAVGYFKGNVKKMFSISMLVFLFGIFFILYTEEQMVEDCGSGCSPAPTSQVKLFPSSFTDVTPISFPDIGSASERIFLRK